MKKPTIQNAWFSFRDLRTEGVNIINKGHDLFARSDELNFFGKKKPCPKSDELCDKGNKLFDKGRKLCIQAEKIYMDAVIKAYGFKAVIDWKTGEIEVVE